MKAVTCRILLALFFATSLLPAQTQEPAEQFAKLSTEPNWQQLPGEDWLLNDTEYQAGVFRGPNNTLVLSNGLIRRIFTLSPNAATIAFDNLMTGEAILRGVKPEAEVRVNDNNYAVGGLVGQPNYAFLKPEWIPKLKADSAALQFTGFQISATKKPFEWKAVRHHAPGSQWPPAGVHLRMDYQMPVTADSADQTHPSGINVSVHYELYDGIPVLSKWITLQNRDDEAIVLNTFSSEILAAVEYGSSVEARKYNVPKPNIHVETNFAFSSMVAEDANHHVVNWEVDPDYQSQVNYLRLTPCLLRVSPELGPEQVISPGDSFTSFRAFILPFDSYDRERQGLARRRMYRKLAPWTTENPLMMHARFAEWDKVKQAIDQSADVGFEMVILTFGSGFNVEDDSQEYLDKMKRYAAYARSKGVEIGGYSLLASRKIGNGQDVIVPEGQKPIFGNSPCIGSEWGQDYFRKLYQFYEHSGFTLLEHDGSYPGDVCTSENHPGHRGYEDSRWDQYQVISKFYKWCRSKGIYLNIPDYYYMTGGSKCAMGYREVNWSLPREQQVIHTRQNIYDGTWTKLVTMGWMFVPLVEYHGGGAAATIEPLSEHLDHYQTIMMSNLGAGVQACYRGPRLYDTETTREMVSNTIRWYKQHRQVLEGDLIHLRRADGRDLDYWLLVNPGGNEKAALAVFNPTGKAVKRKIKTPLYYAGLENSTQVFRYTSLIGTYELDRQYQVDLPVAVDPGGFAFYFFKEDDVPEGSK